MDPQAEKKRLTEQRRGQVNWRRWGPYLAERQWGTVREDYSAEGAAWDYFTHDQARSRAYRWGEDGIGGVSDERQHLCLAVALWNGRDPILKERLFGLTNGEGNRGEDVKELYYYLDATPSHAYLKMLYKYPQQPFPYGRLVEENRGRDRHAPEFELLETGAFDEDRYFDVFLEYAKAGANDLLLCVTAHNRGPEAARLHVLPQLWFRNTWSWTAGAPRPVLRAAPDGSVHARHPELGEYRLYVDATAPLLFCDNDSNLPRLFGVPAGGPFKDGINDFIVDGRREALATEPAGTKAAAHYAALVPPGGSFEVRVRLVAEEERPVHPFADFAAIFAARRSEADAFYSDLQADLPDAESRQIQRQALAGMIWTKQYYALDVEHWRTGDPAQPPPPAGRDRNRGWEHLNNADILSMPDKWEYPYYCAWDLAFHCIPLAMIDADFAKDQLVLLTREWYMHPNGQLPAYEWAFSDVNPPVHGWAAWRVFQIDRKARRRERPDDPGDLAFLERVFHKLLINFTWWVNRKDADGRNVFQGGFLGMDNVGVFDRSQALPTGGHLDQADGTSWMAMYCLNLMRIALELARHNRVYEDIATKFFEHFLYVAKAMTDRGEQGVSLWDGEDEFFYDVLHLPDGAVRPLKLRSMVGLTPLFAVETIEPELLEALPEFKARLEWFLAYRPDLAALVSHWEVPGKGQRRLLSLLRGHRMKCLLRRMLDSAEFLSDFGVRSLSKHHQVSPYRLSCNGQTLSVGYEPAESGSGLFGGNSNWRGPIWFPMNYLLVESLQKFHHYYGDDFRVEYPTGSGRLVTLAAVAEELSRRLIRIFRRDETGRRPVFGNEPKLQTAADFGDYLQFHEYFDGDTGRGLGASHQTGWTGLVAKLLQPRREPMPSESAETSEARPRAGRREDGSIRSSNPLAPVSCGDGSKEKKNGNRSR